VTERSVLILVENAADLCFCSTQPDTILFCETTDTELVHHVVCLFMPQLLPVPSYTAWWQRHIGVNNLPGVVTRQRGGWESELATINS